MQPQHSNYIEITFKNLSKTRGEVIEFSEKKIILKSIQGSSIIVIPEGTKEILFYSFHDAAKETQKIIDKPKKEEKDLKTLAQLKTDLIQVEREQVRETLTDHYPKGKSQVNYGYPRFFEQNGVEQHSIQETPIEHKADATKLSQLLKNRKSR